MQNFHYSGVTNKLKSEKSMRLLDQLKMIDRELEEDHKKLAQRKKLEDDFYEDNNRMNLADDVMSQLLSQKPEPTKTPAVMPNRPDLQFDAPRYVSPPPLQINKISEPPRNVYMPNRPQEPATRPNQILNKRQLEKIKLQNQNAQQEFPFGGHSREKDRRGKPGYEQQPTRPSPEKQYQAKNNYISNVQDKPKLVEERYGYGEKEKEIVNPFVMNDQNLKEQREAQERQYRKMLEQQIEQQKKRKQTEKQKHKEQLQYLFNNYTPNSVPNQQKASQQNAGAENMNMIKRRNPNGQYTSLQKPQSELRPSDFQFFKMQVQDLKNKHKKGRINYEQYDQQIKKLEAHYKCKIEDFPEIQQPQRRKVENAVDEIQRPSINNQMPNYSDPLKNNSQPYDMPDRKENNSSGVTKNRNMNVEPQNPYDNYNHYENISAPIEASGQRPMPYPNYSNYQQPQMPVTQPQNDYQMQMMFKLLDEFKNIFKMQSESYSSDKKVLQEALTKMIPMNPIMMTQQIPASQLPQPPKQFYTEAKKQQKVENLASRYPQPIEYTSQSQISSSYIQKSMSGIVNKIPLTSKQKEQEKGDSNKDLMKFYDRKCKIRKFKGFEYEEADNQSCLVIPSVSNFMQTKNSQNQLNQAFEKDLKNYKRLQKEREMIVMVQKIKKNKSGELSNSPKKAGKPEIKQEDSRKVDQKAEKKNEPKQQIKSKPSQQQNNPFLKKHISNDSNYSQQPQLIKSKLPISEDIQNFHSPNPKTQILEQQEYQTEPKPVENSKPTEQSNYGYNEQQQQKFTTVRDHPSSKLMNIMKTNNEILAKYEMTPPQPSPSPSNARIGSNSLSSIKEAIRADTSKDISSREYFSGQDIAPVQNREYESSLETVRSEEETAKCERKNNMDLILMGSANSNYTSGYQSRNLMSPHSPQGYGSPTIQSIDLEKRQEPVQRRYEDNAPNITGYSQTVESIEESSNRVPSFQKPPNNSRKGRTVSRKKESVVKLGNSSTEGFQRSGLSGIPSEGSREKSSEREGTHNQHDNLSNIEAPKFDSAIYESGYEQSHQSISKLTPPPPAIKFPTLQHDPFPSSLQSSSPPPTSYLSPSLSPAPYLSPSPSLPKQNQQLHSNTNANQSGPKLRSLEQARKIAREYKQKASEDHNRSSVEEKLSELESILQTNKKDEIRKKEDSLIVLNRETTRKEDTKKKDIMSILDGLEDEDHYEPDFESFRDSQK